MAEVVQANPQTADEWLKHASQAAAQLARQPASGQGRTGSARAARAHRSNPRHRAPPVPGRGPSGCRPSRSRCPPRSAACLLCRRGRRAGAALGVGLRGHPEGRHAVRTRSSPLQPGRSPAHPPAPQKQSRRRPRRRTADHHRPGRHSAHPGHRHARIANPPPAPVAGTWWVGSTRIRSRLAGNPGTRPGSEKSWMPCCPGRRTRRSPIGCSSAKRPSAPTFRTSSRRPARRAGSSWPPWSAAAKANLNRTGTHLAIARDDEANPSAGSSATTRSSSRGRDPAHRSSLVTPTPAGGDQTQAYQGHGPVPSRDVSGPSRGGEGS